jgi:hypothetical protein
LAPIVTVLSRRTFCIAAPAASATAQLVYRRSEWDASAFQALANASARIKQVFDIRAIAEGAFLNNIKNCLNGLHFGFGIAVDQIQIVAALHGAANLLNFDDYVWKKYKLGDWQNVRDPQSGNAAIRNIFYPSSVAKSGRYPSDDPNNEMSVYQDRSIQALQARGVRLLCCQTATEEQARVLVKHLGLNEPAEEVVRDMLAHTLPGVLVVPAMVAAIAVLQTEGRYSYITV